MLKHILFPTDHSETAKVALQYVKDLATRFEAEVTLLHAYEGLSTSVADIYDISYSSYMQELEQSMEEKVNQHLGDVKAELEAQGISVKAIILRGEPGPVIVNLAAEQHADMIVLGSRGLKAIRSFLMGSVSNYVVHHAHCPVMVIPTPQK